MITCVFAGHRQIFKANISEKVKEALEKLIETESRIVFLNGNMGRFDDVCAGAVRTLKKKYPEKEIRNCLVLPYYSNRLNTEKSYFQSLYDEILLPEEVECTYYKAAITKRNRWMVDHADLVIAYIDHDYGGAYQTYRYAQKKSIPMKLNRAITDSERILSPRKNAEWLSIESIRLTNEINRKLQDTRVDSEYLLELIKACAQEKYKACSPGLDKWEDYKLKKLLEGHPPLTEFDDQLFQTTVEKVLISPEASVSLELINHTIL